LVKHYTTKNTEKFIQENLFIRFTENQKKEGVFVNYSNSLRQFVSNYDVRYCIATKEAKLELDLQPLVVKTITDSLTGERFILLKKTLTN